MSEKAKLAKELFESGNTNCAQATLCAFAHELGLEKEFLAKLASGFGGGIGRLRETCGAVTGMCMAASLLCGHGLGEGDAQKEATYAMIQQLVGAFKVKNGSILCRELLAGQQPSTEAAPTPRSAEYYASRPCSAIVASAAEILEDYLKNRPAE